MHEKLSKITRGNSIKDEKVEGYLVEDGKIIGEARGFNPYTRFGEVMFYEIDVFGFISGYVNNNWSVLSKMDIANDTTLAKQLERTEYENWKRHNIVELIADYNSVCKNRDFFETFCKSVYKGVLEKERENSMKK